MSVLRKKSFLMEMLYVSVLLVVPGQDKSPYAVVSFIVDTTLQYNTVYRDIFVGLNFRFSLAIRGRIFVLQPESSQ